MKTIFALFLSMVLTACATTSKNDALYNDLGGLQGIEKIADYFIEEFSYDRNVIKHFEKTDFNRFRGKLVEQLCNLSGGPCQYTGDSMLDVHKKMNISEAEFNAMVDALYVAMKRADVSITAQNRLVALLAPMRGDIIYR